MSAGSLQNSRFRILLIEDNLADIMLIKEALKEHEVLADLEILTDGETAYNYWNRFLNSPATACPDLVLLDLNLPKRSGQEILKRIREIPFCATLKIIVISSSVHPNDMQQVSALGIHQYFHKPNHFEEFLELGRVIKNLQSRQEQAHGSGGAV